tara:strand:+ start:308 stop:520 length:213 start_codon:yes stop_codon:yes gene_type:complete
MTITLKDVKNHKGPIEVLSPVFNSGYNSYVKVSKKGFLKSIGGDVAFYRGGLHNSTEINGCVQDGILLIG